VTGQRIALMMQRHAAAERRALDAAATEAQVAAADPELALIKQHLREPFRRAIAEALQVLDDRQRMVYGLHVVDGLGVERIGAVYGVNHSTVSRWLAAARAAVIAEAKRLLRSEMRISADEFESMSRLMASDLDLSVSRILGKRT
jgi:RNA polymerase sigma-70 factor (ECF subfamily)